METTVRRLALGASPVILLLWIFALSVSASTSVSVFAKKHYVGGEKGWAPNVNYTEWASHQCFFLGEWIFFHYQKGKADVVQVNSTDFDRCSAKNPIRKWNRRKSYAFKLQQPGHYYFICSYQSYCSQGMKLDIEVAVRTTPSTIDCPQSPPGSSPVTPKSSSPITPRSPVTPRSSFPVTFLIAALIFILFIIAAWIILTRLLPRHYRVVHRRLGRLSGRIF